MYVCITTDNNNTGRDTNLSTVSFRHNSRSSEIILFKRMYDGYSSFRGEGIENRYMNLCTRHVWANSIAHNAGKIIL